MRTTPENITELADNECFVFGSNLAGLHGAGAAKTAVELFGAKMGVAYGITGEAFAIPTKSMALETLPLGLIKGFVQHFIGFAKFDPSIIFLVTPIGCGLAGYTPKDIAPLFRGAPDNVILPQSFHDVLNKQPV